MYGPQKRPGSGCAKAHVYWAGQPRIGGCYKMQPTGGARAKARSAGWSVATQFSDQARERLLAASPGDLGAGSIEIF